MFDQPSTIEKLADFLKLHAVSATTLTALASTAVGAASSIAAKLFSNVAKDRFLKSVERETELVISRGESWSTTEGSSSSRSQGHSSGISEAMGGSAANSDINRSRVTDSNHEYVIDRGESREVISARAASRVARGRVSTRLKEAANLLKSQRAIESRSNLASNTLTVAQYIIGGLLASSFVQQSLNPKIVGALGILVLIASLFKQHFHPETDAEEARRKGLQLQAFIRTSEDDLAVLDAKIEAGQDHSDALIALMKQMTKRLTEIENPETPKSALAQRKGVGMRANKKQEHL